MSFNIGDNFGTRRAQRAPGPRLPAFATEVFEKVTPYGFTVEVSDTYMGNYQANRGRKAEKKYGIYARGAKTKFVAFFQTDPLSLDPNVIWSPKLQNRFTRQSTFKAFLQYVRYLDKKYADAGLGEHPANRLLYLMAYWFNNQIPEEIPVPATDDLVSLAQLPFSEDFKMDMIKRGVKIDELIAFKAFPQSYVAAIMGVNEADYEPPPAPVVEADQA